MESYADDMAIFSLLDKQKLISYQATCQNNYKFMVKIVYLNNFLKEYYFEPAVSML